MIANNITVGLTFDLTNSPKSWSLLDTFDYSALIGYSAIKGNVKGVAGDGVQFHNNTSWSTPDIVHATNPFTADLPLPLDSDGNVKLGNYVYTYTVQVTGEVLRQAILSNDVAAKTFLLQGNFVTILATATTLKVNDGSDTVVTLDGLPTYDAVTGNTTVTINETLGVLSSNAYFQYVYTGVYSKAFTVAFTYETPTVCIDIEFDQCCTSLTFTDTTAYPEGATVVRLHTIRYPISTPLKANLTSPLQQYITSPVWTGTYSDIFTADIEIVSGILTIIDEATNTKEFKVSTDSSSCQIAACIDYIALKYNNELTTAPTQAIQTGKYLLNAVALVTAYNLAIKCDNTDDATVYLGKITEIAQTCGCTDCDCTDCSDGTSVQVVGCCEGAAFTTNTVVIQNIDGTITVTSATVGDTTTFTISVDQTALGTFVTTYLGTQSINALSDVDTASTPPTTGQTLIWNGTLWVPGLPSMSLENLTNVFDTLSPADNAILYYQNSSGLWKAQVIGLDFLNDVTLTAPANGQIIKHNGSVFVNVDNTLALLSDVDLTGLAVSDIIKWNGTDWVCVDNFLHLLTDVNTTGIVDGSALEWDTATSKWIVFTPKKTLSSLDDVDIAALASHDRFQYNYQGNTTWDNVPYPTYSVASVGFSAGFTGTLAPYRDFGLAFDSITGVTTISGGITNGNGAPIAGPAQIATLPGVGPGTGFRPLDSIPFTCQVGLGVAPTLGFGTILNTGEINIDYYILPATGVVTAGLPIGDIAFSDITYSQAF